MSNLFIAHCTVFINNKCVLNFREEQEKLNVWVAFLNLENMYGTEETLNAVFKRALQYNDQLKVYNQLIQIYTKSNKVKVITIMIQVYKSPLLL